MDAPEPPRRKALPLFRSAVTWIAVVAVAIAVGKLLQRARDGNAPVGDAPSIEGVSFAGSPTLLYFWATWCGVCGAQNPIIESVAARTQEAPACGRVVALEESDHGRAFRDYGVRLLPTMVVVDPKGRVSKRFLGFTTKWQLVSALKDAGGAC